MQQQQTIGRPAKYSGIGLHSGNRVNMTILPAPPNTGIRFRRIGLEGRPEIEARIENVVETTRSTTLGKGNVKIHTVEHVLAALAGFGIDNAIIELDANEPPVGDGSARPFCTVIAAAGIVPQGEPKQPWVVPEPLKLEIGDTLMSLFPSNDTLRISCTSADKQGRFTQFYSVEVTPETWEREIAHARTFCFFDEVEVLIREGLIKGGSLENAIVIRDDAVLTTEPLRYPDEFVRHKILDIIGDLTLLGRPIRGHLVALKPSHTANCELVKRIDAQIRKPLAAAQAFAPPPELSQLKPDRQAPPDLATGVPALDALAVMRVLPHRYPFLMIDKVLKIEGDRVVAVKNVTFNEPYFQGHFPGHPIMPGVMQLEAIAQAAGIMMLKQAENAGKLAYFMSAEQVKWRKPVRPGDVLVIEVELVRARGKIGRAKGRCLVGGEVVSEAEVTFMLQEG